MLELKQLVGFCGASYFFLQGQCPSLAHIAGLDKKLKDYTLGSWGEGNGLFFFLKDSQVNAYGEASEFLNEHQKNSRIRFARWLKENDFELMDSYRNSSSGNIVHIFWRPASTGSVDQSWFNNIS